jgi:hypothetical protein
LSAAYSIGKFDITFRAVRFGESKFKNVLDPGALKSDGTLWNTIFERNTAGEFPIDQTFQAVWISDLVVGCKITKSLYASIGANNLFDVYPVHWIMLLDVMLLTVAVYYFNQIKGVIMVVLCLEN